MTEDKKKRKQVPMRVSHLCSPVGQKVMALLPLQGRQLSLCVCGGDVVLTVNVSLLELQRYISSASLNLLNKPQNKFMRCPQRVVSKDVLTEVVYVLLMKAGGRGGGGSSNYAFDS